MLYMFRAVVQTIMREGLLSNPLLRIDCQPFTLPESMLILEA
jgi:hypothetical protein